MSTKTIAIDSRVYDRLAALKREGESFSKLIYRLLAQARAAHTGNDVLKALDALPPLSREDAEVFLQIVAENRTGERWNDRDLP